MSEGERTYFDVIDPLWKTVDIYNSPEEFLASLVGIPRMILIVYAANFCLSEIHNGGLLQFFWNSTGVLGPEAIEGFAAIQMPELAALVNEACAKLGDPYPRDRDDRQTALLDATGRSGEEIEKIFATSEDFYLAYEEATKPLGFEDVNPRVWDVAKTENGGFDQAANSFLKAQGFLS